MSTMVVIIVVASLSILIGRRSPIVPILLLIVTRIMIIVVTTISPTYLFVRTSMLRGVINIVLACIPLLWITLHELKTLSILHG